MNCMEKIQEKIDIAHGHRLGTAFATKNKRYISQTFPVIRGCRCDLKSGNVSF